MFEANLGHHGCDSMDLDRSTESLPIAIKLRARFLHIERYTR